MSEAVPAPAGTDFPGKTMGIVGLILAIIFPLIGLIVSIIANGQSKKAGYKNGVAKAGIIVGAILTALGILVLILSLGSLGAIFGGLAAVCAELGPGVHTVGGATYTCG